MKKKSPKLTINKETLLRLTRGGAEPPPAAGEADSAGNQPYTGCISEATCGARVY